MCKDKGTPSNKWTNLLQHEAVFLFQQFRVSVDEVQIVFRCGVVDSSKLLLEFFAEDADLLMDEYHVIHHILAEFIWNLVVLLTF